ncbi:MAG TPA: response regulator transcription factor [Acetobacteraceae bacterium]|jgi:DNA-binding NarL/FixJ family response regulator
MLDEFAEVTLLIADRATLFRHGLLGLLKEHRPGWCCAEAGTLDAALAHLRAEPVDLMLYDVQLGGEAEIASLRCLRAEFPQQLIVAMSDNGDRAAILESLAAGANGYVLKSTTLSQLLRAIETVLSGAVFAPATLTGAAPTPARVAAPDVSPLVAGLTERQIEVFRLLSEGCATKTIARRLGLAIGTVKVHLASIYRALDAHNRVEALAKARGGVLHPVPARASELLAA